MLCSIQQFNRMVNSNAPNSLCSTFQRIAKNGLSVPRQTMMLMDLSLIWKMQSPLITKEDARQILADAIPEYQNPEPAITIRVNSPDSGLFEEDLKAVVQSGLDAIVLPKISAVDDIRRADHLLTYLETIRDLDSHIEIVAHPETAQGLRQAHDLCSISDRVTMLVGATSKGADIERALGFDWTPEGREKQYMLSKLAMDGRAAGLNQLCAGPWLDVDNISGLRAEARMARQFGYTGYQLIHPTTLNR